RLVRSGSPANYYGTMEGGAHRVGAPPEICGRSALARRPYLPMPMGQCRTDRMRAEPDPVRGSSGSTLAELSFAAPAQPFELDYLVEVLVALNAGSFRSLHRICEPLGDTRAAAPAPASGSRALGNISVR